jgi:lysophospholipase L1-like esterase
VLGQVVAVELTTNLAEVGRTSQDVIDEQVELVAAYRPNVVTLQIGANDALSDISLEEYRVSVASILDALLAVVPAHRVFVVTTPDFTLTERGGALAEIGSLSAPVAEFNAIISAEAGSRAISVIDISPISGRVKEDPSLVSSNGQDPSEKQYAGWVELIAPAVRSALVEGQP